MCIQTYEKHLIRQRAVWRACPLPEMHSKLAAFESEGERTDRRLGGVALKHGAVSPPRKHRPPWRRFRIIVDGFPGASGQWSELDNCRRPLCIFSPSARCYMCTILLRTSNSLRQADQCRDGSCPALEGRSPPC